MCSGKKLNDFMIMYVMYSKLPKMSCVFPNPANILISGQDLCGKICLIRNLVNMMDYSDIWVFSRTNEYSYTNQIKMIDDLNQFRLSITGKKYVSDCLLVIINEPQSKDIRCVQKLLKMSSKFDITIIITNSGKLRNNVKLMRNIDVECIFNISNKYTVPTDLVESGRQLGEMDYVLINNKNNLNPEIFFCEFVENVGHMIVNHNDIVVDNGETKMSQEPII